MALLLVAVPVAYGKFGSGVEFFPNVEPDYGQVIVHGRGNISLDEKNRVIAEVEKRVLDYRGAFHGLYPRRRAAARLERDQRGHHRRDPVRIRRLEDARSRARHHGRDPQGDRRYSRHSGGSGRAARRPADRQTGAGADRRAQSGPAPGRREESRRHSRATHPDIRDLDDGLPLPGIDWKIDVDKAEAAKYGASPNTVGTAVQLVTNGVKVTEYRPADSDKAVDILVRFPKDQRNLDQIDELRVQTQSGQVPIGNFVQRMPTQRVGYINRVAGNRVMTVSANVARGRAERQGAAGHRGRTGQDRSRSGRDLEAEG